MKTQKLIIPIIAAILINLILIIPIIYKHNHSPKPHSTMPRKIMLALSDTKTMHNKTMHDFSRNWIHHRYGKSIQISREFSAGKNIKGFVVSLKSNPKSRAIIYSLNNGDYFLTGNIIDKHGQNISVQDAQKYINGKENREIYHEAKKLKGIYQGSKNAPEVTIIIDPNSNLFPQQWKQTAYDVSKNIFSVKWALINYIKPMGPNTAAQMLQSKNKDMALRHNAMHYIAETQTGGYSSLEKITQKSRKILKDNWNFVEKYNLYKLPITILKSRGKYYVIHGITIDETLEALMSNPQGHRKNSSVNTGLHLTSQ